MPEMFLSINCPKVLLNRLIIMKYLLKSIVFPLFNRSMQMASHFQPSSSCSQWSKFAIHLCGTRTSRFCAQFFTSFSSPVGVRKALLTWVCQMPIKHQKKQVNIYWNGVWCTEWTFHFLANYPFNSDRRRKPFWSFNSVEPIASQNV